MLKVDDLAKLESLSDVSEVITDNFVDFLWYTAYLLDKYNTDLHSEKRFILKFVKMICREDVFLAFTYLTFVCMWSFVQIVKLKNKESQRSPL